MDSESKRARVVTDTTSMKHFSDMRGVADQSYEPHIDDSPARLLPPY